MVYLHRHNSTHSGRIFWTLVSNFWTICLRGFVLDMSRAYPTACLPCVWRCFEKGNMFYHLLYIVQTQCLKHVYLFAQWSHLSNITSGIIIFFNHSVKLDDTIVILDEDYNIQGRISDIGLFFVRLKTKEGEEISLPNNVFLQKMIKRIKVDWVNVFT